MTIGAKKMSSRQAPSIASRTKQKFLHRAL
jgi:hypothetical protein